MRVTIGPQPITVYSLGRMWAPGNSGSHTLYIFDTNNPPNVIPGASVTVSMAGGTSGEFFYGILPNPVGLQAFATYFVMSVENNGGDASFDGNTVVATTTDASVVGVAYIEGFVPSNDFNNGFVISNNTDFTAGPVNFTYTVGAPPGFIATRSGGPGLFGVGAHTPQAGFSGGLLNTSGIVSVVGGTTTLSALWVNGAPSGAITAQWMIDNDQALSPQITSSGEPWFSYTFDTHTLADGTHSVYCRIIDSPNVDCNSIPTKGVPLIVSNGSLNEGPQTIYTAPYSIGRGTPPKAQTIAYAGVPNPENTTYPFPYTFCEPASARGGDLTRFRNPQTLVGERTTRAITSTSEILSSAPRRSGASSSSTSTRWSTPAPTPLPTPRSSTRTRWTALG
jgi:hypothetical protein